MLFIPTTFLGWWPHGIARSKPGSHLTVSAVSVVLMAYSTGSCVRAIPERDADGRIVRWYGLHTDIDERKQAEDRLQLLLEVTNQVVSNLQLDDLLRAISASVRRVMQCDVVYVCLPRSDVNRLRVFVLDFPDSKGFIREDSVSMEGSIAGMVFRTAKPWMGNATDLLQLGLKDDPGIAEGLSIGSILPLISRNSVLGVLGLARREDLGFTQVDLGFLTQVANQIAIAIEEQLCISREYERQSLSARMSRRSSEPEGPPTRRELGTARANRSSFHV